MFSQQNSSIFKTAAEFGHEVILRLFLRMGADVNGQSGFVSSLFQHPSFSFLKNPHSLDILRVSGLITSGFVTFSTVSRLLAS